MTLDAEKTVAATQFADEKSNAEQNSKIDTVPVLTLRIVEEFYESGKDAPSQSQIVDRIVEIKNQGFNYEAYTYQSQQPSVSRALKKLVEEQKIIKTTKDKYLPYNLETGRRLLKEEIIKTVKFGKQPNFTISISTWLIDVERTSIANAKNLFERFLGPNCYNIFEFNGYLMLLVNGSKDKRKELKGEINEIRREALKEAAKKTKKKN